MGARVRGPEAGRVKGRRSRSPQGTRPAGSALDATGRPRMIAEKEGGQDTGWPLIARGVGLATYCGRVLLRIAEGDVVESMYEAMALAILGGAGGGVGQTAVSAWIDRLRRRQIEEPDTVALPLASNPGDGEAVRAVGMAIQREADRDPVALAELQRWWQQNAGGGIYSSTGQNTSGGAVNVYGSQTFNFGTTAREG